ncbi:MAG: oligosaccharide flippase family protein [Chloroflexota bacterium]
MRARFITAAFWSLWGAIIGRGLTLLAWVVAARLLGNRAFGEVGMIQSTLGLFGVFAGAGLGLTTTKYVAEYRNLYGVRARQSIALSIQIAIITGTIVAVVLLVLADWMAASLLGAPHLVWALRLAAGLIIFEAINGVQVGAMAGLEAFQTMALVTMLRAGFLLGGMVLGSYLAGVTGAVAGLVMAGGVSALANQIALRRLCPGLSLILGYNEVDWEQFDVLWRFSSFALLSSLFTMPAMWLSNVILVGQPQGYDALGIFNAADRWRQLLLFLPSSLSTLVLSMLSHLHGTKDTGNYGKIFGANLGVNVGIVLLPALGLIIFAPAAMAIFGPAYQGGGVTLMILAISAVFFVLNNLLGQVLVSKGAIKWRCGLDALQAVVLVGCSWGLIPIYKENGLALAYLIAFVVTVLGLLLPVRHYLRKSG